VNLLTSSMAALLFFLGAQIALSITYLGYLRGTPGRTVLYPRVLIAAWIWSIDLCRRFAFLPSLKLVLRSFCTASNLRQQSGGTEGNSGAGAR